MREYILYLTFFLFADCVYNVSSSDNLYPVGVIAFLRPDFQLVFHAAQIITGLILTAVSNEFNFQSPFVKLAQSLGQLVGCTFWGVASDVWGRRYVVFEWRSNRGIHPAHA